MGTRVWLNLNGFTISEFDPSKLLVAALVDQARKHRKRPPDEERKIRDYETGDHFTGERWEATACHAPF